MTLFDKSEISIPCPECGTTISKSPEWLRKNDHFECECGKRIKFESSGLHAAIDSAEKSKNDFKKKLREISKRRR